jgi:multimeric flavodoxin WrbA
VPRLLIVHHTPSPSVHAMLDAAKSGATDDAIEGVDVVLRAALSATATDVLEADAYLLGTPANLGYISGAMKHFFDQIYYPCLDETVGRPFGVYLHGNNDTVGAERAIEVITTGLQWRRSARTVSVIGEPSRTDLDACWDLGATLAAGLTLDDR